MEKEKRCILCGKLYTGYGNNPWPITDHGRCCDECNSDKVIPARIILLAMKGGENADQNRS